MMSYCLIGNAICIILADFIVCIMICFPPRRRSMLIFSDLTKKENIVPENYSTGLVFSRVDLRSFRCNSYLFPCSSTLLSFKGMVLNFIFAF